eukprot:319265-Prorocentrum_minimum.AAC.6
MCITTRCRECTLHGRPQPENQSTQSDALDTIQASTQGVSRLGWSPFVLDRMQHRNGGDCPWSGIIRGPGPLV